MIRIGFVCSAGGAAVGVAMDILAEQGYPVQFAMVTDRKCGAEALALNNGVPHKRILYNSREQFSGDAARWLYDEQGVTSTCLFFSRLVSCELFDRGYCYNFHPTLLPAFEGMKGLERTAASTAKFFGSTVHHVDESIDGGPIVGQIVSPVPYPKDLSVMQRISFAQKLYMLLVLVEQQTGGREQVTDGAKLSGKWNLASPGLSSQSLERAFLDYVVEQDIPWNL